MKYILSGIDFTNFFRPFGWELEPGRTNSFTKPQFLSRIIIDYEGSRPDTLTPCLLITGPTTGFYGREQFPLSIEGAMRLLVRIPEFEQAIK